MEVPNPKNYCNYNGNLGDSEFPIIFKIWANPAFNMTALSEEGYDTESGGIYDYFLGQSKYNRSLYGWAGHSNGSFQKKKVEGKKQF
jgi:hypothetical protein